MLLHKYIDVHPRSHWSRKKNIIQCLCESTSLLISQLQPKYYLSKTQVSHIHVYQMEGSMLPHYWRWTNGLMSHILYIPCNNTKWIFGGFLFYNHLKMQKVRDYIFLTHNICMQRTCSSWFHCENSRNRQEPLYSPWAQQVWIAETVTIIIGIIVLLLLCKAYSSCSSEHWGS